MEESQGFTIPGMNAGNKPLAFPVPSTKGFKTRPEAEAFLTPGGHETMTVDEETLTAYVDGSFHKDDKAFSYGMVIIRPEQEELYFGGEI